MENVKKVRRILAVFALSNMAALIYQISWTKNLSYVFGTSVYAIGTVLSCFMAGLAVGSFVFGKRADKSKNPIRLLAYVELSLGLYALLLIPLFSRLSGPYSLLHRMFEGTPFMNLMLFALSFQVLIIPTSLIGGTFPVMNRIYSSVRTIGRDVGLVYSIDTVFAATGALLAGFILLPMVGISRAIALAAAINILAGFYLYRKSGSIDLSMENEKHTGRYEKSKEEPTRGDPARTDRIVFLGFFLSGFAALAAEVVWIRLLSLTLGTSIYAISIITASFLIGLSLGSYLISKHIDRIRYPVTAFAFIEAGIGASGVLLMLAMGNLDIPYLALYHIFDTFYPFMAALFIVIFLLMLVPTTLMGATMPVVSRIISREQGFIGTDIGTVFTMNTAGAILGTFFASFIFIPNFGLMKTGALVAGIGISVSLALFIFSERAWKNKFYSLAGISIVLSVYLASTAMNPLFAGAYYHGTQLKDIDSWKNLKSGTGLVHFEDGLYGMVSVVRQGNYTALRIDGKSESSNVPVELVTEYQLAYIPMFAHRSPEDVMLIGLGGGFTLDAITNFNEVGSIDLIEINPHLEAVARRYFSEYNNHALCDVRVNVVIDDGRNHLLANEKKYDVIISQPSNIWLSGEGGLFTKDMYEGVRARLKKGGIFGQWLPLYEQDSDDFRIFLATFNSVFPYVTLWIVDYDAILVGSMEPLEYDYGNIRYYMDSNSRIRSDFEMMSGVLMTNGKYRLLYQMAVPYSMSETDIKEFSGSVVNTDDHPVLEFSTARNIYQKDPEKPFDAVNGFLQNKYNRVLSPPFINLTKRGERINLSFIDLEAGIDGSWKEETAGIFVDHRSNLIYMEAGYSRGSSQLSILAFPLPDQPLTESMKESIKQSVMAGGSGEAGVTAVNGHWGYGVKRAAGEGYDYIVSWFCEHNDIIYSVEIRGVTDKEEQGIIDGMRCAH